MKTIGLIGGMSWESTAVYYRLLNEMVRQRLGGLHSARLLLWSFDFDAIEQLQRADDWPAAEAELARAGQALARAGADFLLLCTNTMHRVAEGLEQSSGLPLLHIADATGGAIRKLGLQRPLLLGTRYTMEQDFYVGRLRRRHGVELMLPHAEERERVNRVIYEELCTGRLEPLSRTAYLDIIDRAIERGADGVVLGCTEIGLLIGPDDLDVPVIDSTYVHAEAATEQALAPTGSS